MNSEKTIVSCVGDVKFFDHFLCHERKVSFTVQSKSKSKMISKLKELISWSNGWEYERRKREFKEDEGLERVQSSLSNETAMSYSRWKI